MAITFADAFMEVFKEIAKSDALIVEPATDFEIKRCQRDLGDIDCVRLPKEYEKFLKFANGFAWNGFEFYGTYEVREKATGYVLKDIVGYNERIVIDDHILILGTFDEDYYVWDAKEKRYRSLDRLTRMDVDEYESFEDLVMETVGIYAAADW